MEDRKPINVSVPDLKEICIGFVDFDPGPEVHQLALDLTEKWNPLVYRSLVALRPKVKISGCRASTVDSLVSLLRDQRNRACPECDLIIQHGSFEMLRRSTGTRGRVTVLLATFYKRQGTDVLVLVGENLTLCPE